MTKEQYERYKAQGICVRCGSRKAKEGRVMCSECAEKMKKAQNETRKWAREHGFCPRCLRNRLWGQEKICPECLADAAIANKKSREKYYGGNHEYYIMDITRLKAKGLCRGCRKNKVSTGHTYCEACLEKKRRRFRKKNEGYISRSERRFYGLCYRCGNPLDTDKGLCSECCDKVAQNFKGIRGTNAYWKADNQQLTFRRF
jgi:predicted amidophosphoribosyltransferase